MNKFRNLKLKDPQDTIEYSRHKIKLSRQLFQDMENVKMADKKFESVLSKF